MGVERASRSALRTPVEDIALVVPEAETTTTTASTEPPTTTTTTVRATAATARPKAKTTTTTAKPARKAPATTTTTKPARTQSGKASWYDAPAGTCAHRTLPMGTIITVTNLANGRKATCRVADRGPHVAGRVIDLAKTSFDDLAPPSAGVIDVRIEW
jgi:rare lipoprotein A